MKLKSLVLYYQMAIIIYAYYEECLLFLQCIGHGLILGAYKHPADLFSPQVLFGQVFYSVLQWTAGLNILFFYYSCSVPDRFRFTYTYSYSDAPRPGEEQGKHFSAEWSSALHDLQSIPKLLHQLCRQLLHRVCGNFFLFLPFTPHSVQINREV